MNSTQTIAEAQDELFENLKEGAICPVCDRLAKIYKRTIHATMAKELISIYKIAGHDWFYLPQHQALQHGGDFAKLRYWDLVEEDDNERDDGSSRTGWWKVTNKGALFVEGKISVKKYTHVYNTECVGFSGKSVFIKDCLGKKFNYRELMNA